MSKRKKMLFFLFYFIDYGALFDYIYTYIHIYIYIYRQIDIDIDIQIYIPYFLKLAPGLK